MADDKQPQKDSGHEAERLKPGTSSDDRGDSGAAPPKDSSTSANENGQLADRLQQQECIVSGIDEAEKALRAGEPDPGIGLRQGDGKPHQSTPLANQLDREHQATSSQTPAKPDDRIGSSQDGEDPNKRTDLISERANASRVGGSNEPGWKPRKA